MEFKMTMHPEFEMGDQEPVFFTEQDPPSWLSGREYGWFWEQYVQTLKVGDYADTDFRRIYRVA